MHKYSLKTITFTLQTCKKYPHFQMHFYYIMLTFWPKAFKIKYIFCHHQQYVKILVEVLLHTYKLILRYPY